VGPIFMRRCEAPYGVRSNPTGQSPRPFLRSTLYQ